MKISSQGRYVIAAVLFSAPMCGVASTQASSLPPAHPAGKHSASHHVVPARGPSAAGDGASHRVDTDLDLTNLVAAESAAVQRGDPTEITHSARSLNAAALGLLGRLRLAQAKQDEAIDLYRRSLELVPTAERRLELATILMQSGHASDALAEVDAVLASDPESAATWLTRGTLLRDANRNTEAAEAFKRALQIQPSPKIAFALGSALLAARDKAQAQAIFRQILAASGDSAIWHLAIGDAYRDADYLDDAVIEIKAALARDPRVLHGEFFLGLTYLQLNRWGPSSESFLHLRRAVAQHPREYISNFYLGALESTDGSDLPGSDRHLQVAAQADPTKPEVWLYLGINAVREKNNAPAETYLRKAIDLTGSDTSLNGYQVRRAYFALGRLLIAKGQTDEGQAMLARYREAEKGAVASSAPAGAAGDDPTGIFLNLHPPSAAAEAQSPVAAQLGHLNPAQRSALEAAEGQLRTLLGSTYNDLGTAEARQQQYAPALRDFQQGEHWDPANNVLLRNLGVAAFRTEDFAEAARALAVYEQKLSDTKAPLDPKPKLMLALSQFHLGHFAEAVKSFTAVDSLAMQDPRTAYSYAFSLARDGHAQEANRIADKLSADALPADTMPLVCHIYIDTENYAGSQACYRKALAQDPKTPLAHYEIGESLIRLDRPAEAIPELQEEDILEPGNPNVQTALAFALLQTSHKDEARTLLASVTSAHPEHAEGQYEYGKLLLEEGKTSEAIQHLELSARADSSKDYTHYQLGTAYRKSGRAADAEREFSSYRAIKDQNRNASAVPH